MYGVDTDVVEIGSFHAVVEVGQDQDAEDPREWDGGKLEIFHSGDSFRRFAENEFGSRDAIAVSKMAEGLVHWKGPGFHTPWLGIERYSHGVDVYALCGRGSFPDRRWDVSPIVGFWTPDPDNDSDVLTKARGMFMRKQHDQAFEVLAKRAMGDIEVFNQWVAGDVWWYNAKLVDANGVEVEDDSCGGFYGREDVDAEVSRVVQQWQGELALAS